MQVAQLPSEIKIKLATNQLMIAYLKSGLKIECIKYRQIINSKEDKNCVVRPSLSISVSGDVLFYEVVRRGEYWKQYLRDKLERYKLLFKNWESNSWRLNADMYPIFVILGEDEEHNKEIADIMLELGLESFYSHDILCCGANFYHSLYRISSNNQPEFFCFEIEEVT